MALGQKNILLTFSQSEKKAAQEFAKLCAVWHKAKSICAERFTIKNKGKGIFNNVTSAQDKGNKKY